MSYSSFITGRINDLRTILFNMILIILFALVGLFSYIIGIKYECGFKSNTLVILFFFLFLFDQGIKILIKLFWFNNDFPIISSLLYFDL